VIGRPVDLLRVHNLRAEEQDKFFSWIENTLDKIDKNPGVGWLIGNGHYSIFSVGEHGDYDDYKHGEPADLVLRDRLLPLLKQFRVDTYMSGHMHESLSSLWKGHFLTNLTLSEDDRTCSVNGRLAGLCRSYHYDGVWLCVRDPR